MNSPKSTPSQAGADSLTIVEIRVGKGEKPPFRPIGLTRKSPREAVAEASTVVGVKCKDVRPLNDEDGYVYGIPVLNYLPTQVRARTFDVSQGVEEMLTVVQ